MITLIATLRTKPGMGAELEADFSAWSKTVKANEPGTLQYDLNRSREDADVYCVVEAYADEAALKTHMKNLRARPNPPTMLAGPPTLQVFDKIT
jgi:quinol monooxygenase YgiN